MQGSSDQIAADTPPVVTSGSTPEAVPKKRRLILVLFAVLIGVLIIVAGIGSLRFLAPGRQGPQKIKITNPLTKKSGLASTESFLIPFKEGGKYTCLTLNLSFVWSDQSVEKEFGSKSEEIRGIIYESLRSKLREADEIPAAESIKESIISSITKVINPSGIREVYITRFLAI